MTDRRFVCPECGLDYATVNPSDAVVAIRSFPRRYRAAMTAFVEERHSNEGDDPDAVLRRRPDPDTWSALEYAAHIRGCFRLYDERIGRALARDGAPVPSVPLDTDPWAGQDRTDPPEVVLDGIAAAADHLATTVSRVSDDGWDRVVLRDDGERLDVLWLVRQAVHEGSHHLRDIERVIRAVRGR